MNGISRRTLIKGTALASLVGGASTWMVSRTKTDIQSLERLMEDSLSDLPAASISAAILKGGDLFWAKTVGYQELLSKTPASTDSIWPTLGSVSKLVTWTALLQLAEKSQIGLDEDISQYLGFELRNPKFPTAPITAKHLLTHASSLSTRRMTSDPDTMADLFCKNYEMGVKEWVSAYISPHGEFYDSEMVFDPYMPGDTQYITRDPMGVISGYSNLNTMVASTIIENVTKLPLEDYARAFIFAPLGLQDIGWQKEELDQSKLITPYEAKNSPRAPIMEAYTNSMRNKGFMSGLSLQSKGYKHFYAMDNCDYFSPFNSSGLLGSSVMDLTRFIQSFLPQQTQVTPLLKKETIQSLWQVRRRDPMSGSAIGLGWFEFSSAKHGTFWGHDGGGPGILSRVMIDPETGNGVVLLINNFFVDFRKRGDLIDRLCAQLKTA